MPAERLERIREFSLGQISQVEADLHFCRDEEGRNRIEGTVDAVLRTRCTRCLEVLDLPLHADVALLLVSAGSAAPGTGDDVDVVEVEDERLLLAPLVEEEVLLVTPEHPVHGHCEMAWYERGANGDQPMPAEKKENPFGVLSALKKNE